MYGQNAPQVTLGKVRLGTRTKSKGKAKIKKTQIKKPQDAP